MNSLERKELRYQRRKKKREDKLITNSNKYADVNNCFVFSKVYDYAKKCTRNVGYKKSTINFKLHMFSIVGSTCYNIKNNCYKVGKTNKFKMFDYVSRQDFDKYMKENNPQGGKQGRCLPRYYGRKIQEERESKIHSCICSRGKSSRQQ